tara:strand:- start:193 stop:1041 length:849 start_codon:yes stop_codon:yes gene_type:complete
MKKVMCVLVVVFTFCFFSIAHAILKGNEAHKAFIYPVVRVTYGFVGGSGTIVYSKVNSSNTFSTYVITNHHVIASAITLEEVWSPSLKKDIKVEKRQIVYVETFKYRNTSTPIGSLKVEADIVLYSKDNDIAVLKLRSENEASHVVRLLPFDDTDSLRVLDNTIAVGCSLLYPPLPTIGIITRLNEHINSLSYHMSSSQVIYGNSGGAMFLADTGEFIGIPSRIASYGGWSSVVAHMGFFVPIGRVYNFLLEEHYDFLYDSTKTEKACMEDRDKHIKENKKK